MSLRLFDTAAREVVEFQPLTPGRTGIYVCGATVQASPHIGHLRPAVAFDILRRWLTRSGYDVTLIRNVTDIDDKVLAKAAEHGQQWWARAAAVEREFTAAYDALNVIPPSYEPRATGHIPEMIQLIAELIEAGHAYVTGPGDVWFDVLSWPSYGELTHQQVANLEPNLEEQVSVVVPDTVPEWQAGVRGVMDDTNEPESRGETGAGSSDKGFDWNDAAGSEPNGAAGSEPNGKAAEALAVAVKRSPYDFALWKAPKPGEPETAGWDTPWGRGRPGWHLECSAMAGRYLGDEFDIHGGGLDLRFPHHENEQAQSRAAGRPFARNWLHSAWITQSGEKMSKSLGNGLLAAELLRDADPAVIRYAIAAAHYRSMLEWTPDTLTETAAAWERITGFVARALEFLPDDDGVSDDDDGRVHDDDDLASIELPPAFVAAMNEDLGVPAALAIVHETVRAGNQALTAQSEPQVKAALLGVRAMLDVLGLDPLDPHWKKGRAGASGAASPESEALTTLIAAQLEARVEARAAKDWARADQIRALLASAGVIVEDSAAGPRWSLGAR